MKGWFINMEELSTILRNINNYEWSYALYLPEDEIWIKESKGMVLDPDDVEEDNDEAPLAAMANGLIYALDIQTIQSIVINLREQKKDYSDSELMDAFLYYYDNDAYIVLEN
jgi:hypothetical protein